MGVDIASIGIAMDSRPVVEGTKALDALADSAARVEPKTDSAAKALEALGASSANVWRRSTEAQKGVDGLGESSSRTGQKIQVSNGQMADTAKILQAQAEQAKAAAQANVVLGNSTNQLTIGQQQLIERFREQAATLGMSRSQLMAYQAAQMGVTAQTREAIAAVKAHEDAIKAATKAKEDAAKSANHLHDTLSLLAKGYAALKVAEYIKDSALLAARYETLGVVIEVVGRNSGYTRTQMLAATDAIARQGITMVESRESAVKLVQAHVDLRNATVLARIAQDAAVIGHLNSSDAFDRLVNGISRGNVLILRNIGINVNLQTAYREMADSLGKTTKELTENERVQARLNAVIERGADIAGTYEGAMDTAGKQITSMQRYTQDFKTTFGDTFNEVLTVGVMALTGHLKDSNKAITDLSKNNDLEEWGHNLTNLFSGLANTVSNAFTTFQKFDTFARHMDARKAINADADAQSKAVSDSGNGMAEKDAFARVQRIEAMRTAALAEEAADYEAQQFALSGNFDRFERANEERMATRTAKKKADAAAQLAVDKDYMEKSMAVQKAYAGYSLEIQQKAQKALADSIYVGTPTYRDTEGREPKEKVDQAANTRMADQLKRIETVAAAEKAAVEYMMRIDEMRHKAGELGDQEFYERRRSYADEIAGAEIASYNKQISELKKHHNNTEAEAATNAKAIHDTLDKLAAAKAKFSHDDLIRDEEDRLRARATGVASDDANNKYIEGLNAQVVAIEAANGKRHQSASLIAEEAAAQLRLAAAAMAVQAAGPAKGGHTQADADAAKGMLATLILQAEAQERIAKALRDGEAAAAARKLADEAIRDWKDVGQSVAESLSNAFGTAGKAAGAMFKAYADNAAKQLHLNKELAIAKKLSDDDPQKLKAINDIHRQSAQAQLKSYGDMADAARGFFSEGSRGYAAMDAAAKVMHATEVALSLVKGVNAVLEQGKGDPYSAFARMAAMAAVVVGLGVAIGGVNGSDTTAKDRQAKQGTGSVLGDASAKSQSIARAIELSAHNSNIELSYTAGMLRALLSIESSIGSFAALVSRDGKVSGTAYKGLNKESDWTSRETTASGMALGAAAGMAVGGPVGAAIGAVIGLVLGKNVGKIFGGKQTVVDSGFAMSKQTVGSVSQHGANGWSYGDVETDGGWFHSDKTNRKWETLGSDANRQFTTIINSTADAIVEAGVLMGHTGQDIRNRVNAFAIDINNVSLKDKTGEEIEEIMSQVFSKLGDDMAKFGVTGLEQFQQVGEGYLETLVRVASNYANLDSVLASVGMTFGAVGMSSIAAREEFIAMSGGIDELAGKYSSFADNFLTEAQRLAPVQKYVTDQLAAMGLAHLKSRDAYAAHLLALNPAVEAERQQIAALLDLAPAFAKVNAQTKDLTRSAQDIADERADLQNEWDELTMTSAQLQAKALLAYDPSNRAFAQQIALQRQLKESTEATSDALKSTVDRLTATKTSVQAYRDSLVMGSLSTLTPMQKYLESQRQYAAALEKASANPADSAAVSGAQAAATAWLTASQVINASSAAFVGDKSKVLNDMDKLAAIAGAQMTDAQRQLTALEKLNETAVSIEQAILNGGRTPPMPAPDYSMDRYGAGSSAAGNVLTAEVRALREENAKMRTTLDGVLEELKLSRADAGRHKDDLVDATEGMGRDVATSVGSAVERAEYRATNPTRVLARGVQKF